MNSPTTASGGVFDLPHTFALVRGDIDIVGTFDHCGLRWCLENLEPLWDTPHRMRWVVCREHTVEEKAEVALTQVADVAQPDLAVSDVGLWDPHRVSVLQMP